jgi:hypothetical protein
MDSQMIGFALYAAQFYLAEHIITPPLRAENESNVQMGFSPATLQIFFWMNKLEMKHRLKPITVPAEI